MVRETSRTIREVSQTIRHGLVTVLVGVTVLATALAVFKSLNDPEQFADYWRALTTLIAK